MDGIYMYLYKTKNEIKWSVANRIAIQAKERPTTQILVMLQVCM